MPFRSIVCLDDLVRTDSWPTSELVFDLIRLPIFHASGLAIGRSPHRPQQQPSRLSGFSLAQFRALCETDGQLPPWHKLHHAVPAVAANYLMAHLLANGGDNLLVLGHAMPPWLITLLTQANLAWIDLRQSPLRFGDDLVMGLRSNRPALFEAALPMALSADTLLLQANQLAARLRLQRRSEGRLRLPNNPCIFIGQPEDEPGLVRADGSIERAPEHAELLNQLARTGPMMYLPHAKAGDFARIERESIERAIGQRLAVCELDTYDLLACDDELMLLGMNAEALQEAAWFARPAYALSPLPAKPVFDAAGLAEDGYLQIAPHALMGEALWAAVLDLPLRAGAHQPQPQPNLLRALANDWWGYAQATLRGHGAQREAYAQAGGLRQADALRRCENELAGTRAQLSQLSAEMAQLRAMLDQQVRQGLANTSADAMALPPARGRRANGSAAAKARAG